MRQALGGRLRALFLVWLAVSVSVTLLVWLGGFQPDDRILLAVVWAILGAIWLADRAARRFLGERA